MKDGFNQRFQQELKLLVMQESKNNPLTEDLPKFSAKASENKQLAKAFENRQLTKQQFEHKVYLVLVWFIYVLYN